jgi:hypothetical protein
MTKYLTKHYRRNEKATSINAVIKTAGLGATEYVKKYGENALHLNGIQPDSLILQLGFSSSSRALIHFEKKETIKEISDKLNVTNSAEFEGLELKALIQGNRVVGINIE